MLRLAQDLPIAFGQQGGSTLRTTECSDNIQRVRAGKPCKFTGRRMDFLCGLQVKTLSLG